MNSSNEQGEPRVVVIGKMEYRLTYTQSQPAMQEETFTELVENMNKRGTMVPIVIDEWANVIDGKHRLLAAEMLGWSSVPNIIMSGLTEDEKWELAEDFNRIRRHLTQEEIVKLLAERKKVLPERIVQQRQEGKSLRQISDQLGISHEAVRQQLKQSTVKELTVDLPEQVIGKDGKKRKARSTRPQSATTIYTTTANDTSRAIRVCQQAGDALPKKNMSVKQAERRLREETNRKLREKEYADYRQGQATLLLGDFREKASEIDDGSVDVIFTDPPYAMDALPLWNDLGQLAAAKLKPGGLLVSYSGVLYLDEVMHLLRQNLEYLWMGVIPHRGPKQLVPAVRIHTGWKPILMFCKPPLATYWKPFPDMVSGGQAKDNHDWEQSAAEALHYIQALCPKGGNLLDPMMGSGTTLVAGLQAGLGLNCIGIEIDKAAYATAEKRVKEVMEG
jgi:ParB-like chromosome segregation protein Spo0J